MQPSDGQTTRAEYMREYRKRKMASTTSPEVQPAQHAGPPATASMSQYMRAYRHRKQVAAPAAQIAVHGSEPATSPAQRMREHRERNAAAAACESMTFVAQDVHISRC